MDEETAAIQKLKDLGGGEFRALMPDESLRIMVRAITPEPISEGIWCRECEYLESAEDVENDRCMACGCSSAQHIHVKVVAING